MEAVRLNFEKDPSKDHPCQVWFNSVQEFQRSRFKCESLRRTTDAKWWQKLTWSLARWAKKLELKYFEIKLFHVMTYPDFCCKDFQKSIWISWSVSTSRKSKIGISEIIEDTVVNTTTIRSPRSLLFCSYYDMNIHNLLWKILNMFI